MTDQEMRKLLRRSQLSHKLEGLEGREEQLVLFVEADDIAIAEMGLAKAREGGYTKRRAENDRELRRVRRVIKGVRSELDDLGGPLS